MSTEKYVWPDRLQIRDTQLHDDIGGGGQRIYTTAGRGYETREYVRADLSSHDKIITLKKALQAAVKNLPPEIREDVTLHGLPDTSRFNPDYCNDLADLRAGWGLL